MSTDNTSRAACVSIARRLQSDHRARRRFEPVAAPDGILDAVCAAIELVDDRGCDYGSLDAFSLVADNSLNAGIVCGTWKREWPALETLEGIVRADGSEVGRGFGHDVLGGPLIALSWFANRAREGETVLRAGEIVTTGNLIRTQFPTAASRYQFDIKGLGSVTCEVMF